MMSLYVWLKTHLFMELTELTYLIIDCKFLGFLHCCFVANVAPTENTIVYVKHFFQLNIIGMTCLRHLPGWNKQKNICSIIGR